MQQIQYFKSSWGDIKNSPGWFGKLCLLALLSFIPIFGPIVLYGYAYGWAREIAWGTHEPMPSRIFANEDGKLYRRGWFILVLTIVATLIGSVVMNIGNAMQGAGLWGVASGSHSTANAAVSGIGMFIYLIGLVGSILLGMLAWVGSMRISIYDRLSAGFQVGKVWRMFRHDTNGVLRIFGMDLLFGFIIGIVLSIVFTMFIAVTIAAGMYGLSAAGYTINSLQHLTDAQMVSLIVQLLASAGLVGFVGLLASLFLAYLGMAFVTLLVARAMGYWTMQFDVPNWRGQDDPMPFEASMPPVADSIAAQASASAQEAYWQTSATLQQAQPQWPEQVAEPVSPEGVTGISSGAESAVAGIAATGVAAAGAIAEVMPESPAEEVGDVACQQPAELESESGPSMEEPASDPSQLPGFTYEGTAAVAPPVTETGANPAITETPDLLVVVPEPPAQESADSDKPDVEESPI